MKNKIVKIFLKKHLTKQRLWYIIQLRSKKVKVKKHRERSNFKGFVIICWILRR